MARRERYVVGLDVGTSSVVCVVGETIEDGGIDVVGIGAAESRGIRRGLQGLYRAHLFKPLPEGGGFTVDHEILEPEIEGIHADLPGDVVQMRFQRKHAAARLEAA